MQPRRPRRVVWLVVTLAVATSLPGCEKDSPNTSAPGAESKVPAIQRADIGSASQGKRPAPSNSGQLQTDDLPSLVEATREDPDPRVRLHAIETWSQKPGDTLDPATHALVDPDETVRVRAQQLFEDALARK